MPLAVSIRANNGGQRRATPGTNVSGAIASSSGVIGVSGVPSGPRLRASTSAAASPASSYSQSQSYSYSYLSLSQSVPGRVQRLVSPFAQSPSPQPQQPSPSPQFGQFGQAGQFEELEYAAPSFGHPAVLGQQTRILSQSPRSPLRRVSSRASVTPANLLPRPIASSRSTSTAAAAVRAESLALSYRDLGFGLLGSAMPPAATRAAAAFEAANIKLSIEIKNRSDSDAHSDSNDSSDGDNIPATRDATHFATSWASIAAAPVALQHPDESSPLLLEQGEFNMSHFPDTPHFDAKSNVAIYASFLFNTITSLPAVCLGLLLILLDSLSYGVIIFPPSSQNSAIPATAPQVGVQMFLVSTVISQLACTIFSGFEGANASMQIEVMPFLYLIAASVENRMTNGAAAVDKDAILATIMTAFAMSTILTGIVFFALAYFKLGNLIQFFPRQVLIGCIGGIGWFLIVTGIEITSHLEPELSFEFIAKLFDPAILLLWGMSFGLAVLLKCLQLKISHPLFVPAFYCVVPILFYVITYAIGFSLQDLRDIGLLFNISGELLPFYTLWTYYNGLKGVDWITVLSTIPIQCSLVFFALLHVPINIPALGVSTAHKYDMNNELYCHGISNFAAGLAGVPQNYLVYSNSLLVMRCGGASRIAGALLTIGTATLWLAGGDVIRYVPTILIGCLIFHLGIDLLLESLVDTLHLPISRLEYFTILCIVFVMGVFGFTEGIVLGMCLALLFFVLEYSRESVILETFDGAFSTVRRSIEQQDCLDQLKSSIQGVKLYGFLFFGVIAQVEQYFDFVIGGNENQDLSTPVKFVLLDFTLVKGIDLSALQGLQRLKEKTDANKVQMIFCNIGKSEEPIIKSGIFSHKPTASNLIVLKFDGIQTALEYCENEILREANLQKKPKHFSGGSDLKKEDNSFLYEIFQSSNRHLAQTVAQFFTLIEFSEGELVWDAGQDGVSLVIVQTGSFQLRVVLTEIGEEKIVESYLPGNW
ncbi:hypothetical protein HK100_004424 [Physocladia obscura]|uniref:Cyclic nucleotide-binding domain-containing protein n=1 Tax=Physocladia obscura TaxID=109957 RepID=A0AAD5SV15_9FUNG|nr:hypothetical protein HK100_004424 [Physocladia obscura]